MKTNDQTTHNKDNWSFTNEMQQAFGDWVKNLPIITIDSLKNPDREDMEEKSAARASASHTAHVALAERSLDNKD